MFWKCSRVFGGIQSHFNFFFLSHLSPTPVTSSEPIFVPEEVYAFITPHKGEQCHRFTHLATHFHKPKHKRLSSLSFLGVTAHFKTIRRQKHDLHPHFLHKEIDCSIVIAPNVPRGIFRGTKSNRGRLLHGKVAKTCAFWS